MKVMFFENCMWEFDYLKNEIFNKFDFVFFTNIEHIEYNLNETYILVINASLSLSNIDKIVTLLNPIIIIYLSDETGDKNINTISSNALILRQYNYHPSNNAIQIPVGYVHNYLSGISSRKVDIPSIDSRKFTYSFVGEIKSNRYDMLREFECFDNSFVKLSTNNWNYNTQHMKPADLFDIYSNSKFVLCGRGNYTLDSFRIYEAIVSGAIPIVVGDESEYVNTFHYNGYMPPLLFASSWKNAATECSRLLRSPSEIQTLQNKLLLWWNQIHINIKQKIISISNEVCIL
jgi:hypothetical protein